MRVFWVIERSDEEGWESYYRRFTSKIHYWTKYNSEEEAENDLLSLSNSTDLRWIQIKKYYIS
jgi:hypothetical protein